MFPFMQNSNSNSCKLIKREGRFVSSAHRILKFISIHLQCVWLLVGNYNSKGIINGRKIFLYLDLVPDQINQCLGKEPDRSTWEGSLRLHWTVREKWQGGARKTDEPGACLPWKPEDWRLGLQNPHKTQTCNLIPGELETGRFQGLIGQLAHRPERDRVSK